MYFISNFIQAVYDQFLLSSFDAKEISRTLKIPLSQVLRYTKILLTQQLLSTVISNSSKETDTIMYHVTEENRKMTLYRLLWPVFLTDIRSHFRTHADELERVFS
jgi:hypothetical protein